ncbi:hypothetical protein E3N88_15975 [Mikania micrantha]|uniref:Uncharacterized protein n=1 Tax=Mikania micrantha TaxID=192012 RepID=A0A5N6P066_9ASTR|nr:hypothetical protein E3N88_15975 [Mikania micrantha]
MSPDGSKFSKIDRFLVSDHFYHRWPLAILTALSRKWSDHSPLILTTSICDFGPAPFKFYSSLLKIPGIDGIVANALAGCSNVGNPDVILMTKLRKVKAKIKEWRVIRGEIENAQRNKSCWVSNRVNRSGGSIDCNWDWLSPPTTLEELESCMRLTDQVPFTDGRYYINGYGMLTLKACLMSSQLGCYARRLGSRGHSGC